MNTNDKTPPAGDFVRVPRVDAYIAAFFRLLATPDGHRADVQSNAMDPMWYGMTKEERDEADEILKAAHKAWLAAAPTPQPDKAGPVTDAIRTAGAMLANCAFNLAQRPHLTDAERRSLDESRKAWDAALSSCQTTEEPKA